MENNTQNSINLNDLTLIKDRDFCFRTFICSKKYDVSYEHELCKFLITSSRWKNMFIIRYDYCINNGDTQKGCLILWDQQQQKLYAIEILSLKNKNVEFTEKNVAQCISKSIKYAKATKDYASVEAIPVTAIEYNDGEIRIEERHVSVMRMTIDENDSWFNLPGDKTGTTYKIVGDTLEVERIVDTEPNLLARKAFKNRVQHVASECTHCTKFLIIVKNLNSEIVLQEYHETNNN